MRKEVCLVKLPNGKLNLIPVEEILERDNNYNPQVCKIINQDAYGWWVYEKTNKGCSIYDFGLEDEIIVRDITENDIESILKNNGKCFVDANSQGVLSTPSNIRNKKIVIHFTNEEPVQ